LERYDETREKAVYYAQFSWEEVCRKRGGGTFTVPHDKVYKTTKGGASDLEGRINYVAHKSVLSARYLVMLVVHMVGGAWTDLAEEGRYGLGYETAEEAVEALARLLLQEAKFDTTEKARELTYPRFRKRLAKVLGL
jgi:hypothetical protein